jgi:hypothetical protein
VATLEEGEHGCLTLFGRQVDVEAVAVHSDPATGLEEALDVVEIVGVAGVRDLHPRRVHALLAEDLHLLEPRAALRV